MKNAATITITFDKDDGKIEIVTTGKGEAREIADKILEIFSGSELVSHCSITNEKIKPH